MRRPSCHFPPGPPHVRPAAGRQGLAPPRRPATSYPMSQNGRVAKYREVRSLSMRLASRRSVCVFCGSRPGRDPAYAAAATALGTALAAAGFRLVYGAGDVGLMGAVAQRRHRRRRRDARRHPRAPRRRARPRRRDLSRVVVTETMHERKKVMFMNADAIVTLPGGPGSLDELFEVLTWRQLGLHEKPVYLLNVGGYWDPLLALLDHLVAAGLRRRELPRLPRTPRQRPRAHGEPRGAARLIRPEAASSARNRARAPSRSARRRPRARR